MNRNPILLGQAEEIDLIQPQVRAMLDNPGVYIAGSTEQPELNVVLVVMERGTVHAMSPDDEPLDPERFLPALTLRGPYRADTPDETATLRERLAELELACAQAVEFATYVEEHAKGKMEEAARRFLSMEFAQELAGVLKAGREAQGTAGAWRHPDELPSVPAGGSRYYWVAVKRKHDGRIYSFPAQYLNTMLLCDELGEGAERSGNRYRHGPVDEDDGSFQATGWHSAKEHGEYDSVYLPLLNDADELVAWREVAAYQQEAARG